MESLARRYEAVKPHLTERQRRVWLGAEARELGSAGVRMVADAVRVSPDTVRRGRDELDDPQPLEVGRSRAPGGGRKRAEDTDPGLVEALDKLVDPESRGDPMTPLRWTCKSLRTLAGQLRDQGHQVSASLVQRLLHEAGYSLQSKVWVCEYRTPVTFSMTSATRASVHMSVGNPFAFGPCANASATSATCWPDTLRRRPARPAPPSACRPPADHA